jgi:UDP-N-acetylglucosamine 1-carboxyvinyltransferase
MVGGTGDGAHMDAFMIEGGRRLEGRLRINGSKNAALPLLAASLLTDEPVTLRDVPDLADIRSMLGLLGELGSVRIGEDDRGTLSLRVVSHQRSHARYEIVRTMRASISVLGPLLARRGLARVSMPGGCAIGDRPVDLHLRGLAALGASITLDQGDIVARAPAGGLRGATVFMGGPFGSTVLGTANVLCAATLARGETIIESAACEPEIVDLARMLSAMGARIEGAGSPRIVVRGVDQLGGTTHTVMPDRIEAGTLMCAAAITHGDVTLENCPIDAMIAVLDRLASAGVSVKPVSPAEDRLRATVRVTAGRYLAPTEITTQPHPGFPTDLQAQMMALLTLAEGNSVITEKIFPDRFLHVAELSRMGARMFRQGPTVVISGVRKLRGAPVMASDLRASASLVIAGLAAEGVTTVNRVYHLDRGYERFEERLGALGARVERVDDRTPAQGQSIGAEA